MDPNEESNAHWFYHRCTSARTAMQTPLSALQLSINVLQFIKSKAVEDAEEFSSLDLWHMLEHECTALKPDLSFTFDVSERALELRKDADFSEEALRLVASNTVVNGCGSEPASLEDINNDDADGEITALGVDENFSSSGVDFWNGDISDDNDNNDNNMKKCKAVVECPPSDVNTSDARCQQERINFDELHCFQLRTRVLGLNMPTFNELWRYLQITGWTYSNGKYHVPKTSKRSYGRMTHDTLVSTRRIYKHFNLDETACDQNTTDQQSDAEESDGEEGPKIFDNPNDLVEYLDEYCMADYRATPSEMKAQRISQAAKSNAYKRRNMQLRHELLEVAYRDRERKCLEAETLASHSKYGHNQRPCDVCFKGVNFFYPRVACRKCGLIVHTHCYGLLDHGKQGGNARTQAKVDEKGYFTCDVCMHTLVDDKVKHKVRYHASRTPEWRTHKHPNAICPLCVKNTIIGGMIRITLDDDDDDEELSTGTGNTKNKKRKGRRSSALSEIWVHLFCINALPKRIGSSPYTRIRDALATSGEILKETESMRETSLRCKKCATREGNLVLCKGKCGGFYHRLCLQIDCSESDAKKDHICSSCRNDASQTDRGKADNKLKSTSTAVSQKGNLSTRERTKNDEEVNQYFGKSGKKSSKSEGPSDIIMPSQKECIDEVKTLIRLSNAEVEFDEYEIQYQKQFHEWSFALATSQSILLYGLGSKISVLTSFGQHLAQEGDVMSLNGYDPNIDMNAFLDYVDAYFCDGSEYQQSVTQPNRESNNMLAKRATTIAKRIATTRSRPLFLLIHNIDGAGLRNVFAQDALAILTTDSKMDGSPLIRIAASVDNVNAAMVLWSPHVEHKFDWAWEKVHTYRPYIEEVRCGSEEGPTKRGKRGKGSQTTRGGSAALKVLAYLAPRHTEVLHALASLQLSNESNPVSYDMLRDECVKKMLTSSDVNLRNILKELMDHKIIGSEKDKEGNTLLFVPLEIPFHDILNFNFKGATIQIANKAV